MGRHILRLGLLGGGLLAVVGCQTGPDVESREWVELRDSSDGVTTVNTVAGSKWNSPIPLEEEALIGVESGPRELMFGQIGALWEADGNIYVVDVQVPAVWVFDARGGFIRQLGAQGQGPGEYRQPSALVSDSQGMVFLRDGVERINVYSPEGEPADTWTWPGTLQYGSLTIDEEGGVWAGMILRRDGSTSMAPRAVLRVGPEGAIGDPFPAPELEVREVLLEASSGRRNYRQSIPFWPAYQTVFSPSQAWIAGVPSDYSFAVHHLDGRVTRITRHWEPVEIGEDERDYWTKRTTATMQRSQPGWRWSGPGIPQHKPAYNRFDATQDGRVLVRREVPSERIPGCDPNVALETFRGPSCWVSSYTFDLFGLDGTYFGELGPPSDRFLPFFVNGDRLLAIVADAEATIRVGVYRIIGTPRTEAR